MHPTQHGVYVLLAGLLRDAIKRVNQAGVRAAKQNNQSARRLDIQRLVIFEPVRCSASLIQVKRATGILVFRATRHLARHPYPPAQSRSARL